MKKQIIIASTIAVAILGTSGFAILNTASATKENDKLLATTSTLEPKAIVPNSSKNETVYIITDESGNAKTKFIGSTIYNGDETLPYEFKITYFLDGNEISAKELAGKSGHIKIAFDYSSTAKKNGSFIPFLALTTITLSQNNFSNLKLQNAKVLEEKSGNYIIAGYSITGLNENLGTDILPNSFVLEADTTNFKLENTYTIFTNELIADFDTSKLNDLDNLTNSIYQLEDGINQLVNGATELSNGITKTIDGTKTLYSGSKDLVAGFEKLEPYSTELTNGAKAIIESTLVGTPDHPGLNLQIQNNADLMAAIQAYHIDFPITTENYIESIKAIEQLAPAMTYQLESAKNLVRFATGTIGYTQGVSQISEGATKLSNGIGNLLDGENQLYQGSITLKDGLTTFKTSGIDKLVNFASKDLSNFTRGFRNSVSAASSYKSFGGADAKSVKFIVKTPSI